MYCLSKLVHNVIVPNRDLNLSMYSFLKVGLIWDECLDNNDDDDDGGDDGGGGGGGGGEKYTT